MPENTKRQRKPLEQEPSIEAQERLAEIMNDSPKVLSFAGTEWEIKALRPGTQWLIAQECVRIQKNETANFSDVIRQFAVNIPAVVRVLALALLNDRRRIFRNGCDGEWSEEFDTTCDTIRWETDQTSWLGLLTEIVGMLDIEVFFSTISLMQILRRKCLERKTTMEEQKLLLQGQNGDR